MLQRITVREIDMATVDAFRAELSAIESTNGSVRVDFSEVTFIDSTGIKALAQAARTAHDRGQSFAVINASDHTQRVLARIGLADLCDPPARLAS